MAERAVMQLRIAFVLLVLAMPAQADPALDMLDRERNLDLMLIDFAMPGMNGAEVARHVSSRRPGLPVLFVTGFADRGALEGVSEAYIVSKPFVDDELATKVRNALAEGTRGNVVRLRR